MSPGCVGRRAGPSAISTWIEPGHDAQSFATARYSRTEGPHRQFYSRCSFFILHAFQSDEQDHRPLLLGQFGERALQIAKLEPCGLRRWERRIRVRYLQLDARALARFSTSKADMLMVQYRE